MPTQKLKERYFCPECGSTDLRWDASAAWDEDEQRMSLVTSYDDCVCEDCGENVRPKRETQVLVTYTVKEETLYTVTAPIWPVNGRDEELEAAERFWLNTDPSQHPVEVCEREITINDPDATPS